ncbi:MAG: winged helix-turn-helix domain-containing protein [Deltaproteobacteria bacterium]|nr:winged helix-turn-helix domain-containing protein [Deltaproteobacteria bacterium]
MKKPGDNGTLERTKESVPSEKKAALKELRRERAASIEAAGARLKEQRREIALVKKALSRGPGTVPETARETGLEPARVLYYMATLMKYGEVREEDKDGPYFRYSLLSNR